MENFKFMIDRKCTVWFREYHEIEANSLEEAKEIILKNEYNGKLDESFMYQDMLDDTIQETNDFEIIEEETGETILSNLI